MNRVFEAAWEVQRFCEAELYRFCFIGGLALQRWGEPRMTVDADLTVISGFGSEEPIVNSFLARWASWTSLRSSRSLLRW